MNKFSITLRLSDTYLASILCTALEGGSNYWYMIQKEVKPKAWTFFGSCNDKKTKYAYLIPFNEEGALMIRDTEEDGHELDEPVRLDANRIRWGLRKWAADAQKEDGDKTRTAHPSYFGRLIAGEADGDGTTADLFLQYCIFGKVIYG